MADKKGKMPDMSQMNTFRPTNNNQDTTPPPRIKTPLHLDDQTLSILRNIVQTQGTEEFYNNYDLPNDRQTNKFPYPDIPKLQSNTQLLNNPQRLYEKSNRYGERYQENEHTERPTRENVQDNIPLNMTSHVSTTKPHEPNVGFRSLGDLMKVYSNDTNKYGGGDDILHKKLQLFYENCRVLRIPKSQYHEVFYLILKGRAYDFYFLSLAGKNYDFDTMVEKMRTHFETAEARLEHLSIWRETTLSRVINKNPLKTKLECLEIMIDELCHVQQLLYSDDENALREQVIGACQGIEECNLALFNPSSTFEGVCHQLRSSIVTWEKSKNQTSTFTTDQHFEHYWTDRTYRGRGNKRAGRSRVPQGYNQGQSSTNYGNNGGHRYNLQTGIKKKCFVCRKPGCWSTNHTPEERKKSIQGVRSICRRSNHRRLPPVSGNF